jgi:hypothetical protein
VHAQRRRLAASRGADENYELAFSDVEVEPATPTVSKPKGLVTCS